LKRRFGRKNMTAQVYTKEKQQKILGLHYSQFWRTGH